MHVYVNYHRSHNSCNLVVHDKNGYDRNGYNKEGYNIYGFDKNGFDMQGYDISGNKIELSNKKMNLMKKNMNSESEANYDYGRGLINQDEYTEYSSGNAELKLREFNRKIEENFTFDKCSTRSSGDTIRITTETYDNKQESMNIIIKDGIANVNYIPIYNIL